MIMMIMVHYDHGKFVKPLWQECFFISAVACLPHLVPAKEPWADTKAISKERSETFVPAVPAQETKPTMSADQMFADLTVSQLGETFSGGEVSVSEIAATGEWTEEKQKQIGKNLREKHALEYVQVENELRANEIRAIKEVLEKYENRKGDSVRELGKELREKLRSATSDEEKEFIIEDYSSKMEETVYGLENQKQEKLKDVRKLSKRERLRKKKDLYK